MIVHRRNGEDITNRAARVNRLVLVAFLITVPIAINAKSSLTHEDLRELRAAFYDSTAVDQGRSTTDTPVSVASAPSPIPQTGASEIRDALRVPSITHIDRAAPTTVATPSIAGTAAALGSIAFRGLNTHVTSPVASIRPKPVASHLTFSTNDRDDVAEMLAQSDAPSLRATASTALTQSTPPSVAMPKSAAEPIAGKIAMGDAFHWSRSFVSVSLNDQDRGERSALISGNEVALERSDARSLSLAVANGRSIEFDGKTYIVLSSLAPRDQATFDTANLSVALNVPPEDLGNTDLNIDADRERLPPLQYDHSTSFSYQATLGSDPSSFGNLTISAGQARLETSGTIEQHAFYRGISAIAFDDRSTLSRTTLGDRPIIPNDALSGAPIVGGITIERAGELNPTVIRYPTPTLAGRTLTPSTADIYVNGILIREINLPPGTFDVRNLPIPSGIANADIEIKDAYGNISTTSLASYGSVSALRRGATDFQYSIGAVRENAFSALDKYGDGLAYGTYRLGVNDLFTSGVRFEGGNHLVSSGPSLDLRLPVGIIHGALGLSSENGLGGHAVNLVFASAGHFISVSGGYVSQSPFYATSTLDAVTDRPLRDQSIDVSVQANRRTTFSFIQDARRFRDTGVVRGLSLGMHMSTGENGTLDILAMQNYQPSINGNSYGAYLRYGRTLGHRDAASVSTSMQQGKPSETLQYQHLRGSTPNSGIGFTAALTNGDFRGATYQSDFHGQNIDISAYGDSIQGSPASQHLTLAGSVIAIGGRTFFTSPIGDAFTLVRVPGTPNLPIYLDNQLAARTDAYGDALIPGVHANTINHITIDESGLPLSEAVSATQSSIAPLAGTGSILTYRTKKTEAYVGNVSESKNGHPEDIAFGDLILRGPHGNTTSPLGNNGRFYFDNVPSGTYTAEVVSRMGVCRFRVTLPIPRTPRTNLGRLVCIRS